MPHPEQILKQYWGYDTFRSLQKEIIEAVLLGHDTLAIMPTGGGKSICFQVPTLIQDGLCIVITPLIALMKDQVEQLKKRDIGAVAIFSGMSTREIDIDLDRCAYDPSIKFLYVSPERLETELFLARLPKIKVNLIAVDEAHCISQWGHDFRPAYLQIAKLRELLPKTPIIALTASATDRVCKEICEILQFKNEKIFKKSFFRSNLSYSCVAEEQKEKRLLKILTNVSGSAIVYVRSRLRTKKIAEFLSRNKINATYYHAGLSHEVRGSTQTNWINNKTRVIVATNAFGMGIDKPDVRLVVHFDMPSTPEAYYQEAGRAGRDEKKAYAVLLYAPHEAEDLLFLVQEQYPTAAAIARVYQAICNYLKIAVGSSRHASYDFDLESFCHVYELKQRETFVVIKILERENLLQLNSDFFAPSKILIALQSTDLYEYQVMHPLHDGVIKTLLRMYGGEMFSTYVAISENMVARNMHIDTKELVGHLQNLAKNGVLYYEAQKTSPQLTFLTPRLDAAKLPINKQRIEGLKNQELKRINAIIDYVQTTDKCRSQAICNYFEKTIESEIACGICDNCIQANKHKQEDWQQQNRTKLLDIIANNNFTTEQILDRFSTNTEPLVIASLRMLNDNNLIKRNEQLIWKLNT